LTNPFARETSERKPETKPDDSAEFHWHNTHGIIF